MRGEFLVDAAIRSTPALDISEKNLLPLLAILVSQAYGLEYNEFDISDFVNLQELRVGVSASAQSSNQFFARNHKYEVFQAGMLNGYGLQIGYESRMELEYNLDLRAILSSRFHIGSEQSIETCIGFKKYLKGDVVRPFFGAKAGFGLGTFCQSDTCSSGPLPVWEITWGTRIRSGFPLSQEIEFLLRHPYISGNPDGYFFNISPGIVYRITYDYRPNI